MPYNHGCGWSRWSSQGGPDGERGGAVGHPVDRIPQGRRRGGGAQSSGGATSRTLVGLARARLEGMRHAVADEEDAALSAFDSFCRRRRAGRFPRLDDRDDLWRLLVVITERKASDQAQRERRLKRGGGKIVGMPEAADVGSGG